MPEGETVVNVPTLNDDIRGKIPERAKYILVYSHKESDPTAIKAAEASQQMQMQKLDPKTRDELKIKVAKGLLNMRSKMVWLCKIFRDTKGNPVRLQPFTSPTVGTHP